MARSKFWSCHGKDCKGKPCGYQVPVGRFACDACGHQPPAHISCPSDGRHGDKGSGKGSKGNSAASKGQRANGGTQPDNANAKRNAKDSFATENASLRLQLKELRAKAAETAKAIADAVKSAAAAPAPDQESAVDTDMGPESPDLAAEVASARERIVKFKAIPADLHHVITGGYDGQLAALEKALEKAVEAKRSANPVKKQLEDAEAWQERASRRTEAAKKNIAAKEAEMAEFTRQLAEQREELAALEATTAAANEKVALLAALFATERSAKPPAQATSTAQGAGAPAVVSAPATSWVSVEEAEKLWRDREATVIADREARHSEYEAHIASLLTQFKREQDEADDEDDKVSITGSEAEPARKERRTAVLTKRKEAMSRFESGVQKSQLKRKAGK